MSSPGTRFWRLVAISLLAVPLMGAACNPIQSPSPFDPDGSPRLELSPTSLTLEVGRTGRASVRLGESPLAGTDATWSSADPSIATVDEEGNVTCHTTGEVRITAAVPDPAGGSELTDSILVACTAPVLLTFEIPPFLRHTHVIGESPCPDPAGQMTFTNPTLAEVTVEIVSDNPGIETNPERLRLGPGESALVVFLFNCTVRQSFRAEVILRAVDEDGRAQVETVTVDVTVE